MTSRRPLLVEKSVTQMDPQLSLKVLYFYSL